MLANFGVGQVLWSMIWFVMFFLWITLVIRVFADIFRSRDLSGGAKAVWVIATSIFPFLGVLIYLIVRGDKLHEHDMKAVEAQEAAVKQYIQQAAGTTGSAAEELNRLADLRDRGVIDADEFATLKAKVLG